jgi:hypothetical protein
MGRPLKIAKAQAVLTITDTAETGSIVTISGGNLTTSPTVGIAKGMSFIVATTVGGLTANTIYYVNSILSNTTFDVSATQLSVQPQVMATLSDTTGQTVKASFNVVDAYFNNPVGGAGFPATNANTYGVVGGNTAIVGKQVLANVAFGVAGTGTVFASTGSNIVTGYGTDFANLTTGTTLYALWGDGTGMPMRLGVATSTHGLANVAVANTNNTGNIIRTTGNAQTLVEDSPVTFSANLGGLTTGTTYWVLGVANASAFTVALTPGGAEVDLSDATGTPNASQQQVVLSAVSANNATGQYSTGDGFVTALAEAGYIVRQKGKTKYLVTGVTTGITGAVYTANVANTALQPNTMTIIATNASSGTQYVASLNDYQTELFPATVAPGSLVTGTVYTIYSAGTTDWTSVGAMANMTGITFTATGTASGTGLAVLSTVNPDVISSFNSAEAANANPGQPNPIVTINNA